MYPRRNNQEKKIMEIVNLVFIPSFKMEAISFEKTDSNQEKQPAKRVKKKKFQSQQNQQMVECITKPNKSIQQVQIFHIFGDLCFNSSNQIKIGSLVTWSEIGFEYLSTQKIQTYDKFIDLQMSFNPLPSISLEDFSNKLQSIPSLIHQKFHTIYLVYKYYIRYMKKQYLLKKEQQENSVKDKQESKDIFLNQKRKRSQIDVYNKGIIFDFCSSYKLSKFRKLENEFSENESSSLLPDTTLDIEEKSDQFYKLNCNPDQLNKESELSINIDSPIFESPINSNHSQVNMVSTGLQSDNEKTNISSIEIQSLEVDFSSIIDELELTQDQSIQQQISKIKEDENKNEEFNEFSEFCFKILKEKIVPNHNLYSYVIGRVDFLTNQIESSHMGYSKDFLQLICMDSHILENLFLRGKSYDLIQDHQMALEESLKYILHRSKEADSFKSRIKLRTLDGFDLWVDQKYHKMMKTPEQKGTRYNYFFGVGELDIQLPQLEALIHYRQAQSSGNINYDEFIQKELSYLLEDVEYSVQSQGILEKYYNDKLVTLVKLKEEQISKKIEPLSLCGFKKLIRINLNSEPA